MEHYWCLRWLLQENVTETTARVIRENLVRFERLPIVTRVADLPPLRAGHRGADRDRADRPPGGDLRMPLCRVCGGAAARERGASRHERERARCLTLTQEAARRLNGLCTA